MAKNKIRQYFGFAPKPDPLPLQHFPLLGVTVRATRPTDTPIYDQLAAEHIAAEITRAAVAGAA